MNGKKHKKSFIEAMIYNISGNNLGTTTVNYVNLIILIKVSTT